MTIKSIFAVALMAVVLSGCNSKYAYTGQTDNNNEVLEMSSTVSKDDSFEKSHISLEKPLLVVKAKSGILACAYISEQTCNKTDEACAIVSGVNDYDDMYAAKVIKISKRAGELGVKVGDSGIDALNKMNL